MPNWTKAQSEAIYEPSGAGSIIVSAGAGSGKTAVLVERIVNLVLNGVSIDELLVVTFTEAAAAEMKERISKRLNETCKHALDSGDTEKAKYLREQVHLTASADINTIDSFCLGVVKNNFHILGVDPNFSVMDESEGEMMAEDALDELFNELYSYDNEDNERFEKLVRTFSSNRSDDGLKSIIKKLYNFTQAFAEPVGWMREKAAYYSDDMTESVYINSERIKSVKERITFFFIPEWDAFMNEMDILRGDKEADEYWGKLWDYVKERAEAAKVLSEAETWEEISEFRREYVDGSQYRGTLRKYPSGIGASEEEWNKYYIDYKNLKKDFYDACKELPDTTREEFNKSIHSGELKSAVEGIVWLTELFTEAFEEKKTRRNVKSFSDIEHLTYRLFKYNENICGEYRDRYSEILIDEFQDTNGLQDAIFTSISKGNKNVFMVGDLKQSIYRFRGGDPMIFKQKSARLSQEGSGGKRIILSENFRSRQEVIKSINAVFLEMMTDSVGDVDYGVGEALGRDAENECYIDSANLLTEKNKEEGYGAEFHRVAVIKDEQTEEDDIGAARAEAVVIADKIRSLVDGKYLIHRGDGKYSPIEYKDIVILMKSTRADGQIMRDVLESRGIDAFLQKEEYFERREIKLMLSLISVINNHLQDIPLIAVMRSPIGSFSETELAMIRINSGATPFYKAVKNYKIDSENASDSEKRLENKCRRFVADLRRWREYVKRKSIASLIWTLYEETGFYDFMGALEGGEESQANLTLLYERAKRYEASGFKGVFNFIRYIERMEKRRDDISGAQLINENHNVVRIMTVHKSKGLEFPVVFFARTNKKITFTHSNDENRLALHKDLGIGVDYYNYEDMYVKELPFRKMINEANKREHLSEEMRLLYVAATRAKEKLIVTASYSFSDREEYMAHINTWNKKNEWGFQPENARSISDWIMPVAIKGGECWKLYDVVLTADDYEKESGDEEDIKIENPEKIRELVKTILEFDYKYPASCTLPAKTSVTAIKEMEDEENIQKSSRDDDYPLYMAKKPAFMQDSNMGARIGTAHHQVMAYIDIDAMRGLGEDSYREFIAKEIARIANAGQIEREIAENTEITKIICENVSGFFMSGMGKNILSAKNIYREMPFEIEIAAAEYVGTDEGINKDDRIIVQGIIDLYYENAEGDIILVDYKTDRCKTAAEQQAVGERYKKQLELYERAMEKILKRNVKEKYLYLFSVQNVLKLD